MYMYVLWWMWMWMFNTVVYKDEVINRWRYPDRGC